MNKLNNVTCINNEYKNNCQANYKKLIMKEFKFEYFETEYKKIYLGFYKKELLKAKYGIDIEIY